jgi:hypothetical protein
MKEVYNCSKQMKIKDKNQKLEAIHLDPHSHYRGKYC